MKNTNNASIKPSKAIVYQLCVAIERCFSLDTDQSVLIEHHGDVSVEHLEQQDAHKEQVEVKAFEGLLTPGHRNIWNTLYNWMDSSFNPSNYHSLILYTTQEISADSSLSGWNSLTVLEKIQILKKANQASENRFVQSGKKQAPVFLEQQRFILSKEKETLLLIILERFYIAAKSPELSELCNKIKRVALRIIHPGKVDECLNNLIGFISGAQQENQERWVITYQEFTQKMRELNSLFGFGTRTFPQLRTEFTQEEVDRCQPQLFVEKIKAIELDDEIVPAIRNYLEAQSFIHEELSNYACPVERFNRFAMELRDTFATHHRFAARNCSNADIVKASQTFFEKKITEPPPKFDYFESVPSSFKNGVLHTQLDVDAYGLHWRLK